MTLAAHCNPKGRIISLFRLFKTPEGFYMNLPQDMLVIALSNFRKYSIFFKAELEDISDSFEAAGDINTRTILLNTPPTEDASERWHLADIQAGLPMIYANTSEKFLPHYINLPALGGVSFNKGCYTGQEIIARMQHRGTLKYHMVYRCLNDVPQDDSLVDVVVLENEAHSLIIEKISTQ